ncbi:tetratricopeptide repeat protein [Marinobacter sp. CHS3-4]|uniref:tetratricopeptide repeat protein n=1 Tax=Marinobacter sp. CHS3-4 TaxID=3045174 RepID=UPI0024B560C4|nr:tetratricopeptide repeat protein [Marinobacter sp. CHS3-4]MDI9245738.1 tetratricopeptide repeat protein [Marinobacter sp. CHS3-4]
MSWVKCWTHASRWALGVVVVGWLAGCATTAKDPEKEAALAEEQARQEALMKSFNQAVDAMQEGDQDLARQQFRSLNEQHPERTGPLANLGILAMKAGESEEAKTHFEKVVAIDESHAPALNHLGVIARENGEFEKAETYYRDALTAEPDYLPAMMNLAILLDIYLGRPGEALPLYEKYQSMAEEPNPRLKDWIFDAKNRI